MSNFINPWTAEVVDQLTALWAEGLSCSKISRALGHGISRCAVIGKVNRLGLPHRAKPAVRKPYVKEYVPKLAPIDLTPLPEPAPADLVKLIDLERHHCRFPYGDPLTDVFGFCGRKKADAMPYCANHAGVVYRPEALRRMGHGSENPKAEAVTESAEPDVVSIIGEAA